MIKVRKGGYTILDLSNVALTASGGAYVGVAPVKAYTALKDGGKPVMVSGLKFGGNSYSDTLATYTIRAASKVTVNYLLTSGYFIAIEVDSTGGVKVTLVD